MYSTHNEENSVAAERFIRTLNNTIYKYMNSISENVYIDKLDVIVNKYNTYHTTIKMKPVYVKSNTYINISTETNGKDSKFKNGDIVRISGYKYIFAKSYTPNWSEEVFLVRKVKNTVPWTYAISDLQREESDVTFYEKELQKTDKKELRVDKVRKRESNKLYVKYKGCDHSFNSWKDEKGSKNN